jgi:primosomal protein N''
MLNKKITVIENEAAAEAQKKQMKAEQTATKPEPLNQVPQAVVSRLLKCLLALPLLEEYLVY